MVDGLGTSTERRGERGEGVRRERERKERERGDIR